MGEWTMVALQDLFDLIKLFPRNPHIRPGEPPKVENTIEHSHRFRTKLPVDVFLIYNHRVFSFVKPEREIGFTQTVNRSKDRVRLRPLICKVRIFSVSYT